MKEKLNSQESKKQDSSRALCQDPFPGRLEWSGYSHFSRCKLLGVIFPLGHLGLLGSPFERLIVIQGLPEPVGCGVLLSKRGRMYGYHGKEKRCQTGGLTKPATDNESAL